MSDESNRIILITGNTETLGYFSRQIAMYLYAAGSEVFIWDMTRPTESREAFDKLPGKASCTLITFNFIGLNGEGQFRTDTGTIWEENDIPVISIMVDSPIYYYRQLTLGIRNLSVACIDRNHVRYVRRWHPYIENVYFWPLCGNEPVSSYWLRPGLYTQDAPLLPIFRESPMDIPLSKRPVDIVFAANLVTRESIEDGIAGADKDTRAFVSDICDELILNPDLPIEDTLYRRLKDRFPDEDEEAYPEAMYSLAYVDLYVRSHFRSETVKALADAGYPVYCIGQDWDKLDTVHPENIIHTDVMMTSHDCIRAMSQARISLNVMPHFKQGAHDRVFTSMLAGCVSVTDSSGYLDEVINPWRDYAPYRLGDPDSVIQAVERVFRDPELAQNIAAKGRERAEGTFKWKAVAASIKKCI